MQFDSEHAGPGGEQWRSQRPESSPEIQDEIIGLDTGTGDDPPGRTGIKTVVAPLPSGFPPGGHDAP